MPAAINGKWYIYYKGSYAWSHFEAPQAKGVTEILTFNNTDQIIVYPNPFENELFVNLGGIDNIVSIELINYYGKTVEVINKADLKENNLHLYLNQPSGLYVLKINTENNTITELLIRR